VTDDDADAIAGLLARHRRNRLLPWRCRCGNPHPCGARRTGLDDRLRVMAREAVEWYPVYFARQANAEQREPELRRAA
jgi:hypothetical protein